MYLQYAKAFEFIGIFDYLHNTILQKSLDILSPYKVQVIETVVWYHFGSRVSQPIYQIQRVL